MTILTPTELALTLENIHLRLDLLELHIEECMKKMAEPNCPSCLINKTIHGEHYCRGCAFLKDHE